MLGQGFIKPPAQIDMRMRAARANTGEQNCDGLVKGSVPGAVFAAFFHNFRDWATHARARIRGAAVFLLLGSKVSSASSLEWITACCHCLDVAVAITNTQPPQSQQSHPGWLSPPLSPTP